MVVATCHRCGREWDYTGGSDRYGTCPNCKTSVVLNRGSERPEPEATGDSPERPDGAVVVEVEAGASEPREVTLIEAVEAMDRSISELYELSASESETVGEVARQVEERGDDLDELCAGIEELAGYFRRFIEEAGGKVEYDHVEPGDDVSEALETVDVEEFA
jgi:hypothetical protein